MAILGSITGKLHVSIGDGIPIEVATFEIPVEADANPLDPTVMGLQLAGPMLSANLAGALRAIADALDESLNLVAKPVVVPADPAAAEFAADAMEA